MVHTTCFRTKDALTNRLADRLREELAASAESPRAIMLSDSTACHLHHSRHPGRYQHPEYLANMRLLATYEDMDLEQLNSVVDSLKESDD